MNQLNEKLLEDRVPTKESGRDGNRPRQSAVFVQSDDDES